MSSRVRISVLATILISALRVEAPALAQSSKARSTPASPLAEATAQISKHNLQSAEDSIWQVLSTDPNNIEALLLLGIVRGEQQRYPEAEALFQRVLQLDPKSATAHLNLGKTYLTENKIPEATDQYRQAQTL